MLEPVSGGTYLQFSTKQPSEYTRNRAGTPENPTSAGAGYPNAAPPRKSFSNLWIYTTAYL